MFTKTKTVEVPVVVELEPQKRIPELDETTRQAVLALSTHPGFQYLLARLGVERAALESQLKRLRHSSIREVDALQLGIFWAGWLEDQLRRETRVQKSIPTKRLNPEEDSAYQAALSAYKVVSDRQD